MIGPTLTLIEWDAELPSLSVLRAEAAQAQARIDTVANTALASHVSA